ASDCASRDAAYETSDRAAGPLVQRAGAPTWALRSGQFTGHPFEVRKGGLNGLDSALRDLEEGKNSAVKYVVRIVETPGVGF
ncbi:hypothetical protein KEM55_008648, partial [Ascosphaera atra]